MTIIESTVKIKERKRLVDEIMRGDYKENKGTAMGQETLERKVTFESCQSTENHRMIISIQIMYHIL